MKVKKEGMRNTDLRKRIGGGLASLIQLNSAESTWLEEVGGEDGSSETEERRQARARHLRLS